MSAYLLVIEQLQGGLGALARHDTAAACGIVCSADDMRERHASEEGSILAEQSTSKEQALIAARAIDEKKGTDIVIQHVGDMLDVTDYFVIATAANNRRADAIAEAVEEALRKEANIKPIGREGFEDMRWVLLDYGTIVVHIFLPAERDYYRLEQLWDAAETVDVALAGIEDPVYSERIANLLGRQQEAAAEE